MNTFIFKLNLYFNKGVDNETRVATMAKIHEAGAVVTVSLGGANDQHWESMDAKALATTVCYPSSLFPSLSIPLFPLTVCHAFPSPKVLNDEYNLKRY